MPHVGSEMHKMTTKSFNIRQIRVLYWVDRRFRFYNKNYI